MSACALQAVFDILKGAQTDNRVGSMKLQDVMSEAAPQLVRFAVPRICVVSLVPSPP